MTTAASLCTKDRTVPLSYIPPHFFSFIGQRLISSHCSIPIMPGSWIDRKINTAVSHELLKEGDDYRRKGYAHLPCHSLRIHFQLLVDLYR